MKHIKKLFAYVLSLVLALVLAIPAYATEITPQSETYTITIKDSTAGHTYEAYQIFKGDLYQPEKKDEEDEAAVLSNITWGSGVSGDALLADLKADEMLKADFAEVTTAAAVAEKLSGYGKNSTKLDAFAQLVGKHLQTAAGSSQEENSPYTISGLEAGYYFVKDKTVVPEIDVYTKFILELVQNTEVSPKSDVPSVEKKVLEHEKKPQDTEYGEGFNDVADYDIGEMVDFKLIGSVPKMDGYKTYKYIFHDTLSSGLTLEEKSIRVYVSDSKGDLETATEITSGFVVDTTTDDCTFDVRFDNLKSIPGVAYGKYIVITYQAKLNENAEIGLPGNTNEVHLEFSNNPNQGGEGDTGVTPPDEVIVFTYELDTTKVDGANNNKLKDAEFVLYKNGTDDNGKTTILYAQVNAAGQLTGWAPATGEGDSIQYPANSTLKSDDNGLFSVIGLDDGTYYLRETKAPAGYNLPSKDFEIVITATTSNGQTWIDENPASALTALKVENDKVESTGNVNDGTVDITIANNAGSTLPETGGIGTTIFYIGGGILAVGACILLITKKRMDMDV